MEGHEGAQAQGESQAAQGLDAAQVCSRCELDLGALGSDADHRAVVSRPDAVARRCLGMERLFAIMDEDRSNTIKYPEFVTGMEASGIRPVPSLDDLKFLFREFDTNGNGTVEFEEMLEALKAIDSPTQGACNCAWFRYVRCFVGALVCPGRGL